MELPKRSEIKSKYREEKSESVPEKELRYALEKKGLKPRLQYPIDKYFADLAFPEYKLAIEYDGIYHLEVPVYDYERHAKIRSLGWNILRIMNKGHLWRVSLNLENQRDAYEMDDAIKVAVDKVLDYLDDNYYHEYKPIDYELPRDLSHIKNHFQAWYKNLEKKVKFNSYEKRIS